MFKFGGIYLDLDVIVQQSFDTLPHNFVGAECEQCVNFAAKAIHGFRTKVLVMKFGYLCME